jgi:hypothetical protein
MYEVGGLKVVLLVLGLRRTLLAEERSSRP